MVTDAEKLARAIKFEMLIDRDRIAKRVAELGRTISQDYEGLYPVLVCVLKGAVVFCADLMRHINTTLEVEFVTAASYREGKSPTNDVVVGADFPIALKGRHVLLVEGIVDSGRTASRIREKINQMEPASLEIVALLDKPNSHRADLKVKYKGFSIGNEFVIGYGMDNTQQYRHLPFIGRVVEK